MTLRLSLLGAPLVERDGQPVAFDTRKAVALLAYLGDRKPPAGTGGQGQIRPARPADRRRGRLDRSWDTRRVSEQAAAGLLDTSGYVEAVIGR
jgi:hypothetical protein